MKKVFFILFLISFCCSYSQEETISALKISTQKIDADQYIGFDNLGSIYYSKNNVLFKEDKSGKLWQFKNLSLGKFTRVDIQNPLKLVVFYENCNMVILLDNQLTMIQKVIFSENNSPLVITAVGLASQNRLWIYNSLSQQIGLFDYINNTFESITPSFKDNIKYYESDFNYFQWVDDNLKWFSCDIYGKITDLGKVSDFDKIQSITNRFVIYSKNQNLYVHNSQKNITFKIINVENSFRNFYFKDEILSIFTTQGITNYKITIPQ